jgi:wyosine [tRNA(Phe)-imidazoG37] synthetase (radical SAM superfamily)
MKSFRYLFGPVPSRRLGRSLGVDLVPFKTCTLDCVFCQLGATPVTTQERRDYVPIADVIAELKDWLRLGNQADFITLSGSGEPTLHSRFGEILEFARQTAAARTALLSNGTTFSLPEVRSAATHADVVKLSLSAWDQASFEKVNRPCAGLAFEQILAGYHDFRRQFRGQLWLEVFLVPGINTSEDNVRRIAGIAAGIQPDRIQLNTAIRPAADTSVGVTPETEVRRLAELFTPRGEVIADYHGNHTSKPPPDADAVLALLGRHPSTIADMARTFALSVDQAADLVRVLRNDGRLIGEDKNGQTFFRPSR